jgi:hypothetical protein
MCAGVTRTIVTAIPDTADRRGGRIGALIAKSRVVGSITGASFCRRRVGTKDLGAPLGAVPIGFWPTEYAANATQAEPAAHGHGDNGSQRMASRGRTGQGFGQLVKVGCVQGFPLLRARLCENLSERQAFLNIFRHFFSCGRKLSNEAGASPSRLANDFVAAETRLARQSPAWPAANQPGRPAWPSQRQGTRRTGAVAPA